VSGASVAEAERLVVVVLSHEKRELTLECLASVRRLRYRPLDVIVVDNASSDGSADAVAAAYPEVLLVRSPVNTGAAGGRNLGVSAARERFDFGWLLFVDDDARLDDRLADELIGALRADPRAGMATPKAYRTLAPELIASAGGMRVRLGRGSVVDIGGGEPDRGQYDEGGVVESCVGYAVLVRRSALDQVGGFDESYNPYGWEEVDFSLRLRTLGWTIRYVPAAICWHAGGAVGRGGRRAEYERGKAANYLRLMRRHATALEWVAFAAVAPFRLVRLARMRLGDRSWRVLRAHALGVLDVFRRG
jgi:GT2 family glycosyltransferase